jgi:hypothetical protein
MGTGRREVSGIDQAVDATQNAVTKRETEEKWGRTAIRTYAYHE